MRFTTALGASLALHVAIGLAPPGLLSLATIPGDTHLPGGPAPLWVKLGPNSHSPVLLATSDVPIDSADPPARRQAASAAALASTEEIPRTIDPRGESPTTKVAGGEPGLPEPQYFRSTEVSTPAYIQEGLVALPKELARDIASGRMIVMLYINERGTIDRFVVEDNELRNDMREVLAGQFDALRFSPAIKENQPVKSRMRIEITLQPPGPFKPTSRTSATGN